MKMHLFPVAAFAFLFVSFFSNVYAQKTDSTASAQAQAATVPSSSNWKTGENMFVGNIRFANGGPACNSCHNVSIKGFVSGGALAKDLTQAVTRLTPDGAKAFFAGSPMPMPQMQQSYSGKPLTAQEANNILAFLTYSDELAKTAPPSSDIGKRMLAGGIVGVVGLLMLFSIFWFKRKQRPVNYNVFQRPTK
ncbi:MAG: c-type cytochrome, partial [Bacteroidetes bacterium]|nr:c-type cytochrome [Bacteroidota bacterium]